MKKSFFFAIPFIFIFSMTITAADDDTSELLKQGNFIINSLESMMTGNPENKSQVAEIVNSMFKKIDTKELLINIDIKKPENIYDGASFDVPEDRNETPHISINPYLINLFKQKPSIVYSILIHEFTHAYSYFNDKEEFIKAHKNNLELYLYEMDASYIEGLFIKEFSLPRKFELSKYENLLLQSLENDNLSTFSICLRVTDRDLTYALVRIVDNKQNIKDKIAAIEEIGNKLLNNITLTEQQNDWEMYCSHVTLSTYIKYVPEILLRIAHNDLVQRKEKGYFNINNYPEIEKILIEMVQRNKPYNEKAMKYYKNMYVNFKEI